MSNATKAADLAQIDIAIDDARKVMKKADALKRLEKNKDFKLLIREGYFEGEAIRLVHLRAMPAAKEMREEIDGDIAAIGSFRLYLSIINQMANQASQAIGEYEEARDDIENEVDEEIA